MSGLRNDTQVVCQGRRFLPMVRSMLNRNFGTTDDHRCTWPGSSARTPFAPRAWQGWHS
jgi:hypothetical protein